MNSHKNARLTALGRAELVHRVVDLGQPARQVAASLGVCVKTVCKWVARFEAEGAVCRRLRGLIYRREFGYVSRKPGTVKVVELQKGDEAFGVGQRCLLWEWSVQLSRDCMSPSRASGLVLVPEGDIPRG